MTINKDSEVWHPASELPEVGHWYKVRGKESFACGFAALVKTEWGSVDWLMHGIIHLDSKDMIVEEWRELTEEERKDGES